ncbi:phage portal protein [Microvirga yunnanensis]|uniref:phage portal protein n=1 Tax=Microvirga yunnanensis TaxID=2953740 RepID=UPI0021CA6BED|nr:phage portal protein [Microvirga sp. HBU67655]
MSQWNSRAKPGVKAKTSPTATRQAMPPSVRNGYMLANLLRPSTAYDAANNPRIPNRPSTGPASGLLGPLDFLRNACQHEIRNNPLASKAVDSAASNIVADGFRVRTPYKDLQRLWDDWNDECLTSGLLDFNGTQFAVAKAAIGDGDTFPRFRARRDGDMRTVPLQMQLMEAAQVPSGKTGTAANGNAVLAGVEFDALGRRVGFHALSRHPDDHRPGANNLLTSRIDGRDVMHILFPRRLDLDVRGEPWLARNLVKMNDFASYDDAEVVRKGTTANWGGFIRMSTALAAAEGQDVLARLGAGPEGEISFGPGQFPVLPPGWDVTMAQPSDVGGSYEPFMRIQMMLVAAGMGLTYEQLTGDWRGANDRTYRASMLEFVRLLKVWQGWIIQQFIKPVWRRFVAVAFASGCWTPPEGSDPLDWYQCEITAPSRGYINPLQEVETFIRAVQAGFLSRTRVADQLGIDITMVDLENAADQLRAGASSLTYVTHQNPLVAGFDPSIVQAIRQEVTKDLLSQIARMKNGEADEGPWGDADA